MRSAPTSSEAALWRLLRAQQLGVRFRGQVPTGRYIADFAAPSARLLVEVDGGWHEERARAMTRLRHASANACCGCLLAWIRAALAEQA